MTTEMLTRPVRFPVEEAITLPDGLAVPRGEPFADALFCVATGLVDGVDQHRAAAGEARLRGAPTVMQRLAEAELKEAGQEWMRAAASGDADALREAARARHAAAQEVEAMSWRPTATWGLQRGPASVALKAGIAERRRLVAYWAAVVGPQGANLLTAEQWEGGLAWAAQQVYLPLERLEQARDLLEDPTQTDGRKRKTAEQHVREQEGLLAQARALAGLTDNEGAVR